MNEKNISGILVLITITFLASSIFFYYKWNESKIEFDSYVITAEIEKTKNRINKPMEEVTAREENLYPKIDAKISAINNNIKLINENIELIRKNKITKEQSYDTFKNKSSDEISKYLTDNGISNTVIRK